MDTAAATLVVNKSHYRLSSGQACLTTFSEVHRELVSELASRPTTPSVVLALRRQVGEAMAKTLLDIAGCQPKAVAKFGNGFWMVTLRSLQQATDSVVANYKASLFQDRIVVDLCGGVGGDAMGFARRGSVVTVDLDPQMTRMAAENLRSIQAASAVAVNSDAMTYFTSKQLLSAKTGLHIDPDRRPDEQRTTSVDRYSPNFDFVAAMIDACDSAIVKLAPASQIDKIHSTRHHRQWISFAGSVREQSLICGTCIDIAGLTRGGCSAVRLFRDGQSEVYAPLNRCESGSRLQIAAMPLRYVVDIDPAVRAAGLSASLAMDRELACLGDASGFFTTDQVPSGQVPSDRVASELIPSEQVSSGEGLHDRGMMQVFECFWSGPADIKQLRKAVRDLSLSVNVVKVRGTGHDPAILQSTLRTKESGKPATLLIGRSGMGVYAVLGSPIPA